VKGKKIRTKCYKDKEQKAAKSGKRTSGAEGEGEPQAKKARQDDDKDGKGKEKVKDERPKGTILKFQGVGPKTTREDLKAALESFGKIAFVDFEQGKTEGFVRFTEGPEPAQNALKATTEKSLNGRWDSIDNGSPDASRRASIWYDSSPVQSPRPAERLPIRTGSAKTRSQTKSRAELNRL